MELWQVAAKFSGPRLALSGGSIGNVIDPCVRQSCGAYCRSLPLIAITPTQSMYLQVTVVCDEGDWLRSEGLHHARGSETCGGLVLALLLAYASGMWLEALFIAALAALLARPPGVKGHGP